MDFLDPKKRRNQTIQLFIGYFLSAIALGFGTIIMTFAVYGFGRNPSTGQIIQNGLVFIDSSPISADIFLNGQARGQTDARLVLGAGNYSLEIKRAGYRSWSNRFELSGGTIQRFIYPFLWPQQLDQLTISSFNRAPTLVSQSPDRHWLVVQNAKIQPTDPISYQVFDISKETPVLNSVNLPSGLFSDSQVFNYKVTEWSTDNRHFLLRHDFDGKFEYILIDREKPTESLNLNKSFSQPTWHYRLRDKKADQFYAQDPTNSNLYSISLSNRQAQLVLPDIKAYKSHAADQILYVRQTTNSPNVEFRFKDGGQDYLIRRLPVSSNYLLDLARFNNSWYISFGTVSDGRIYIYQDPVEQIKKFANQLPSAIRLLRLDNPQYLSFSANARFISLQSGSQFAVYDAENQTSYKYDAKLTVSPNTQANWMDGHRLIVHNQAQTVVFDFDGSNIQTLNPSHPNWYGYFDRDYKKLFYLDQSSAPVRLVYTNLLLENQTNTKTSNESQF